MSTQVLRPSLILFNGALAGYQFSLGLSDSPVYFISAAVMVAIALVLILMPMADTTRPAELNAIQDFLHEQMVIQHVQPVFLEPPKPAGTDLWDSRWFAGRIMTKHLNPEIKFWWHCYGGITTEHCEWGEGHYCMVILGESTVDPDDINAHIEANGTWSTPLMYLKSFDHDPTDEEKEKITPPDYRSTPLHTEKGRRPELYAMANKAKDKVIQKLNDFADKAEES